MSEPDIPILPRGNRGLVSYGPPMLDSYAQRIEVYESSSAEGPHVWLSLEGMPIGPPPHNRPVVRLAAHLNVDQAKAVIARLEAWLNDDDALIDNVVTP
jgi:hypothetical protein